MENPDVFKRSSARSPFEEVTEEVRMALISTTENGSSIIVSDLIENAGIRYTMVVLHVLAIVVASVGNGFLMVFICRHWKQTHRNVTAILILNLAVCDFINVIVHQPMKLVDILVVHEDNLTYCQVSGFFSSFFSGVAFMSMVAIGQERFLLICHPFKAKRFLTMKNTIIVLLSVWAGVFLCMLPIPISFVYVLPVRLTNGEARFCIFNLDTTKMRSDIYVSMLFIIFFIIPLVIISLSYVSIFRALYSHLPGNKQQSEGAQHVLQQRRSLAKVMLSVAVIFVISNFPFWVMFLIGISDHDMKRSPIFTMLFLDLLTMISPMMNPIVYSIRFRTLRKGLTHGGSIYAAIKHMSLNRNSSTLTRSAENASTSNSLRFADASVIDRDLTPIREEPNGQCDEEHLSLTNNSLSSCSPSDSV